jgi:hypothetical protein
MSRVITPRIILEPLKFTRIGGDSELHVCADLSTAVHESAVIQNFMFALISRRPYMLNRVVKDIVGLEIHVS